MHTASAGSGLSFWRFDEDHPARLWVYDHVTSPRYDMVMLVLILMNCCFMALEGPHIDNGSTLDKAMYWSDVAFTILFGVEVLAKSFAFTFRLYIKETTNQV
jgi:hypothetical protein